MAGYLGRWQSKSGPEPVTAVAKITVMIADDSPVATNGLRSILRRHPDIEVVAEADGGLEALRLAEESRPNVVLMDAQMPGMDGVEATRRLKGSFPDIKVLFMAVHGTHIDAAIEAGADGYLMKDSGAQELLEAIRKLAGPATES